MFTFQANGQTPQSETFTTSKFEENTSKNVKVSMSCDRIEFSYIT